MQTLIFHSSIIIYYSRHDILDDYLFNLLNIEQKSAIFMLMFQVKIDNKSIIMWIICSDLLYCVIFWSTIYFLHIKCFLKISELCYLYHEVIWVR